MSRRPLMSFLSKLERLSCFTCIAIAMPLVFVGSAKADCPAAPLGSTNDMVVSFLAAHGTQAAPSVLLPSSVKEGMLLYDSGSSTLKICNGTVWQTLSVNGADVAAAGSVPGAVQFRGATGNLAADDANFVWDDTNNRLGIGTASPQASAKLDISSTSQGFLPPRMTTAQRDAIATPADGLVVYNSTLNTLDLRANGAWVSLATGAFSETDPQVGTLTANKWCAANAGGTAIDCTADTPTTGAAGTASEVQFRNSSTGAFAADNNLVWDNTNKRLGIGTATPTYAFHSVGGFRLSGSSGAYMWSERPDSEFDIILPSSSTKRGLSIHASTTGSSGNLLEIYGHNGTNYQPTLTVRNGGNVGIGTTSPLYPLEVQGFIRSGNGAAGGGLLIPNAIGNPAFQVITNQGNAQMTALVNNWGAPTNPGVLVGTTRADGIAFQVGSSIPITSGTLSGAGTSLMTVLGNGNVGIGTLSPNKKLHVVDATVSAGNPTVRLEGAAAGYGAGIEAGAPLTGGTYLAMGKLVWDGENSWNTTASTQDSYLTLHTTVDGVLTERLRINSAGNVGIGTTNPTAKLFVEGTSGYLLRARSTGGDSAAMIDASGNPYLVLAKAGTAKWALISGYAGTDKFSVFNYTGNDNALTIDTAGNVGIGTTTPTEKLDVSGKVKATEFCNASGTCIDIGSVPTFPTGAIMAFDLTVCPTGWSEYTAARGRFLRGIDNGAGLDPAGTRAPGNQQTDSLQNITGSFSQAGNRRVIAGANGAFSLTGVSQDALAPGSGVAAAATVSFDASTVARTSTETRPVNVAVLFCRKD